MEQSHWAFNGKGRPVCKLSWPPFEIALLVRSDFILTSCKLSQFVRSSAAAALVSHQDESMRCFSLSRDPIHFLSGTRSSQTLSTSCLAPGLRRHCPLPVWHQVFADTVHFLSGTRSSQTMSTSCLVPGLCRHCRLISITQTME